MSDLEIVARVLRNIERPNRNVDAQIAVAISLDLPEPMDGATASLKMPTPHDDCAPGTYWLVQRSGMSLRTAPEYTGSPEAKLPGENITVCVRIPGTKRWSALHVAEDGRQYCDAANTEVLARRLACLKAMADRA